MKSFQIFKNFFRRELEIFLKNYSLMFFSYLTSLITIIILIHFSEINTSIEKFLFSNNEAEILEKINAQKIKNFSFIIFFLIFSSGQFFVSRFSLIDLKENIFENYFLTKKNELIVYLIRFWNLYIPFLFFFIPIFFLTIDSSSLSLISLFLILLNMLASTKFIFWNMIFFAKIENNFISKKINRIFSYIARILIIIINIPSIILCVCSDQFSFLDSIIFISVCFIGLLLNYLLISNVIIKK